MAIIDSELLLGDEEVSFSVLKADGSTVVSLGTSILYLGPQNVVDLGAKRWAVAGTPLYLNLSVAKAGRTGSSASGEGFQCRFVAYGDTPPEGGTPTIFHYDDTVMGDAVEVEPKVNGREFYTLGTVAGVFHIDTGAITAGTSRQLFTYPLRRFLKSASGAQAIPRNIAFMVGLKGATPTFTYTAWIDDAPLTDPTQIGDIKAAGKPSSEWFGSGKILSRVFGK